MDTKTKKSRTSLLIAKEEPTLPFDVESATAELRQSDAKLRKLIDRIGPCKLELQHMQDTFETLLESIVYQQLTGKAAATILGRVKDIYGSRFPTPQEVLRTEDDTIRAAGLSRAKLAAIKDLALKADTGLIPDIEQLHELDNNEIVERLTAVRGIGEWTVQMLLIFRLGRPDVLPINDYGVRKGFGLIYLKGDLPAPKELLKHGERWRPWRTLASWYLWRSLD
jgi:DNA-3-methyladenine glycosylase II